MATKMQTLPRADRAALSDLLAELRGSRSQGQVARMAGIDSCHVAYFEDCPAAPLSSSESRQRLGRLVEALALANGGESAANLKARVNALAGGVA